VGGVAIGEFVEAEQKAASDPSLAHSAGRLATAFAADPGGANWVYAAIVVLRPGIGTEAFFRDWRDTFDAGACERAGGVAGHASATLGGRTVEIGTCASSVRTYHTLLVDRGILVSISSFGDAHWGQQLIEGLRP